MYIAKDYSEFQERTALSSSDKMLMRKYKTFLERYHIDRDNFF